MHLLKRRVDNLIINMCVCMHGIYIDDLKKYVNCMKQMTYFITILYIVLKNCLKHYSMCIPK